MLDAGRVSHVHRGSCLPKACTTQRRSAKQPAGLVPRTSSVGVARAMTTSQVLLRPIYSSTSSILASIELPFASTSTSRLDYGLPSADAYVSDFEDLRPRQDAVHHMPRVAKHRPQRRSWSGDPFARRALHGHNNDDDNNKSNKMRARFSNGGASSASAHSSRASRHAATGNTLTWRGATFPWVSRFALQKQTGRVSPHRDNVLDKSQTGSC